MKIGLLFGSFDPIHIGHVALATYALNTKLVDKIIIIPAYHNPWKQEQPAPFKDRMQMCCMAVNGMHNISVSDIEEYYAELYGLETVNTHGILSALKKKYNEDELVIIMANETFNELKEWFKGDEILHENRFLIFRREDTPTDWRLLAGSKDYWVIPGFPRLDVSSTMIRDYSKRDLELIPWAPKEVANYIKSKKLYK